MSPEKVCYVSITSFILGMIGMGFVMDNSNRDFGILQKSFNKAEEICESLNSTPAWIDLNDEIKCANGVEVNYEKFDLGETK
ncbi:MAG: hypothetical protein Tp1111DCM1126091_6 [Prokaryotic dsDNA virus sp.]|nr:MAG: hypothetical protein Tp1111DCM1126091_6 [Prokaryotic dsDNA virus sp.]|tara:strand:- start:11092 stop:11337 length:246 start_codon:yes stop_codon:yes gene_type:complete